jgi:nucleoid-associated protein YgaU
MAALALRAQALQTQATILNIMDAASTMARDLTSAATTLAVIDRAAAGASARRVDGIARLLQTQCLLLKTTLAPIRPISIVPDGDPGGLLAWHTASIGATIAADTSIDRARSLRGHARSKIGKSARIYVVRSDDTLESIARSELGDASRSGELGIRSDELRPGLNIRIPETS